MKHSGGRIAFPMVTEEIEKMSAELEALGGGDARIGHGQACVVCAPVSNDIEPTVSFQGGKVMVRDPRSMSESGDQSVRKYNIQDFMAPNATTERIFKTVGQPAVNWLLDGFNATVVTLGQTGTGKTRVIFGNPGSPATQAGLVLSILKHIQDRTICEGHRDYTYSIGLSMWEVLNDHPRDLIAPEERCTSPSIGASHPALPLSSNEFPCINVSTLDDALTVLSKAREKSSNWAWDGELKEWVSLPGQSHVFVRIVVHCKETGAVSTLHMVDLVGSRPLGSQGAAAAFDEVDSLGPDVRGRRLISRQLLAVNKMISDIGQKENKRAVDCVVSGREFRLTRLLAPLLAGNACTFLIATISPHPDHYLDTVNTLRIATRSRSIKTACMRTICPGEGLSLISVSTMMNWHQAAEQWEKHDCKSRVHHGYHGDSASENTQHGRSPTREIENEKDSPGFPTDRLVSRPPLLGRTNGDHCRGEASYRKDGTANGPTIPFYGQGGYSDPKRHTNNADEDQLHEQLQRLKMEFQSLYGCITPRAETQAVETESNYEDKATPRSGESSPPAPRAYEHRAQPYAPVPNDMGYGHGEEVGLQSPGISDGDFKIQFNPAFAQASDLGPIQTVETLARPHSVPTRTSVLDVPSNNVPPEMAETTVAMSGDVKSDGVKYKRMLDVARQEIKEVKETNETILTLLDREKRICDQLRTRMKEMEGEMVEVATEYEVRLDNVRLSQIALKTRCQQLQSESMFSDVFEKYETQTEKLEEEIEKLREENDILARKLALKDIEHIDNQGKAKENGGRDGESGRIQMLRKQLKRADVEKATLRKETNVLKRKERLFDLHKKQAAVGTRQCNSLERKLADKEKEVVSLQLEAASAEARIEEQEKEIGRLVASQSGWEAERQRLCETIERFKEQLNIVTVRTSQSNRFSPKNRNGDETLHGSLDLCKALKKELAPNGKAKDLLEKLVRDIQSKQTEWTTMRQREAVLVDMALGKKNDSKSMKQRIL